MADLTTRDAKLVQYLNEAYGKEKELETALEAHISMTTRAPYRKRLREHLTETKRHAREVERRIRQLGGDAEVLPLPGPDALAKGAGAAVGLGSRAVAAAKGPLHAIRGTGEQEKMLKNAKTEYSEEHEEIATYRAIEELASSLGDGATAQLARAIRREEERMASFLARLIPTLTKAVVQEEVPASERPSSRRGGKRAAAKRSSARTAQKRSPARASAKRAAGGRTKRAGAKAASANSSARGSGPTSKRPAAKRSAAKPTAKRKTAKSPTARGASAKRTGAKTTARRTSSAARAKR